MVRFQDIDAAGIVFYPRILEYFHDAYLAHLERRGVDLPQILREKTWLAPLARAEADFAAPMRYGDAIVVAIEGADLGRSSITVNYRVFAAKEPSRTFAKGKTVHVFVDPLTKKTREIPEAMRAVFTPTATDAPSA